jgi:hypothetical protein
MMTKNYLHNLIINNTFFILSKNNIINSAYLTQINSVININQTIILYIGSHLSMDPKLLLFILLFI